MTSPLRRSTRAARNADAAGTPEPMAISPSASPSKIDRKRKRVDEPAEPSNDSNGNGEHVAADDADAKANGTENDAESESSTSKKTQLPKKIQLLLGLPSSSTSKQQPKRAEPNKAAQKAQELVLSEQDAKKLSTILGTFDAADLIPTPSQPEKKGKSRTRNGSSSGLSSLEEVLRPGTSLRELRERLLSIREPLLSKADATQHLHPDQNSSPSEQQSKDLTKLSGLTLVLGLVDQLASRLRQADTSTDALKGEILSAIIEERARALEAKNASKTDTADNSDDENDVIKVKPVSLHTDDQPTSRYALHMRLPRGDYFTKAIALDRDQISKLDPAQADLVQISTQSEAQMRAFKRRGLVPTPTLGQRLGRSGIRHRTDSKKASQQPARPQPVTFLNYGNYASFAPSYDSSASSISYGTSSALWRQSVRAQRSISLAWGSMPFQSAQLVDEEEDDLEADAPAEPPHAPGQSDMDVDEDVAVSGPHSEEIEAILHSLVDGVSRDDLSGSLETLSKDELVTSHLRFNMMLLHRLQEFQWARLRRSYRPTASVRTSTAVIEEESPSAEEEATAALLLESLSSLVALQPRAVDLASHSVESIVPEASKLRAFSASSGAIDPDLLGDVRDGFWGALDANVVKLTKTGSVASETPLVLRDNTTIRLADGSGSKAKKTSRRAGPGAGHTEERGHGTLERFAGSRTYDHKQDRHDIEPVRPVLDQRASSASRSNVASSQSKGDAASPQPRQPSASAMSPNARMHAGYLPSPDPAMTPQAQRLAPGPNSSYAFASPAGGMRMPPNAMGQYPQPGFAHPGGQANWQGQQTRQ
ncbi:hypothetical protein NDA16_001829 [Ustilago loliicola]|nr:hypothetical protein NDA16_001829 [Ustilago loliicola]